MEKLIFLEGVRQLGTHSRHTKYTNAVLVFPYGCNRVTSGESQGKQEEWRKGSGRGGEAVGGGEAKIQTIRQRFHGSVT